MPNLISPNEIEYQSLLDDYFYNYLDFNFISFSDIDFTIIEAIDNSYKYIKLLDSKNQELLSVIRLERVNFNKIDYYCINKSKSLIEGRGYATLLYEYCFKNMELPIISDKYQTKGGSSDLWHKLIIKNRDYQIYLYYIKANKFVQLSNEFDPYLVWGIDNVKYIINNSTPQYVLEDLDFDVNFENNDANEILDIDYPSLFSNNDYIDVKLLSFINKGKVKDRSNVRLVVK